MSNISTDIDECVLPFLPMLYVAWSDAVLSPSELRSIDKVVHGHCCLKPAERKMLKQWLDPKNPPSATQLQNWLTHIRENSDSLRSTQATDKRFSLAELGINLQAQESTDTTSSITKALEEIEEVLGIQGFEATAEMLGNQPHSNNKSASKTKTKESAKSDFSVHGSAALPGSHTGR